MKSIALVIFLCVHFFVTQGAPIGKSGDIGIDELFEVAWEFHNKLKPRQEGLDNDVIELRTSISKVLRETSKDALEEVEDNARQILELEKPVKEAVSNLKLGDCSNNLKVLLNGITEFTGFQSSNCVKRYNEEINKEIKRAQDLIANYDGAFTDFQQLVTEAFVGNNKFTEQAKIIEQLEREFEKSLKAWELIKPETEKLVENLNNDIEDITIELKLCMKDIQEATSTAYNFISSRIQTCVDFEDSLDLYHVAFKPLTLQDILPNRDLNLLYEEMKKK